MAALLQSPWIVMLVGTIIYLATTVAVLKPKSIGTLQKPDVKSEEHVAITIGPSWTFQNEEFDKLVKEVKTYKEAMMAKEQQLKELESRLQIERREIGTITQSVERIKREFEAKIVEMQKEFEQSSIQLKAAEMVNLKKLAKMHSTMSPEGSATLLRQMPETEAVKILSQMKVDEVSAIMEIIGKMGPEEAKKAATFMDKLRSVVPPASSGTGAAKQGG